MNTESVPVSVKLLCVIVECMCWCVFYSLALGLVSLTIEEEVPGLSEAASHRRCLTPSM